ncbi:peptide-methionine (S)-S-oxide reductase MsrA [Streptomyces sp. RKAG337]|uniref:peptide-methionine (S)-S-oxide reductase MsrA n=1 Tax=Streptomyces sp. RKAG337 TaxID=2893404 RepID=UPI0020334DC9|nr:peptide-methionine (S)-S-oxide reductase MsrA [Streptomyces sp. RKAG337]MCM2426514.1 peptide-methionine (S)-S-oxide reductase MsrA [Streptomyces sp. RKAG337]
MFLNRHKNHLPSADEALRGRTEPEFDVPARHTVLGKQLTGPYPADLAVVDFGMGCFWGAERKFWQTPGVWTTLVGYQGGHTPNPTYDEVCSGLTAHTEAVRVVYDPALVSFAELLKVFWESHNPTQGNRQGNDSGTQYRSAVYTHSPDQLTGAQASRDAYQQILTKAGYGDITTEILPAGPFYPAEPYHQQYLDKNPDGYCGIGGTGVDLDSPSETNWGRSCPTGIAPAGG